MTLKTLVTDADGHAIENMVEDFSSLREAKIVFAHKRSVDPGCKMLIWKSKQDPMTEHPWKVLGGKT